MFTLVFLVVASILFAIDCTRRIGNGIDGYSSFYIAAVAICFVLIAIHETANISRSLV